VRNLVNDLENNREKIINGWLNTKIVQKILKDKNIGIVLFKKDYALDVFDYFISIIKGINLSGTCPVIEGLLRYFSNNNIMPHELFNICTKFKFNINMFLVSSNKLTTCEYEFCNNILDANLSGVLEVYQTILEEKTKREISLLQEIDETQKEVIIKIAELVESKSYETGSHVHRVCAISYCISKYYGLSEEESLRVRDYATMHDIGKIAIPDSILNKPGKLTDAEFDVMKTHPVIGYKILENSSLELFRLSAQVAHEHHEKWNGKGYPRGIKEEEICLYARIVCLADVFDALSNNRVYKKAWPLEKIKQLFIEESGEHFDPVLAKIVVDNIEEIYKIEDF